MPTPDTGREIAPYIAPWAEIRNTWIQVKDGAYVSPQLATEEDGTLITNLTPVDCLFLAEKARLSSRIPVCLTSCEDMLSAIRGHEEASQQAKRYSEWSRNGYNRFAFQDGKPGILTKSLAPFANTATLLEGEIEDGFVAGFNELTGAVGATTLNSREGFDGTFMHYGPNHVLRLASEDGRVLFYAGVWCLGGGEPNLGFRFSAYDEPALRAAIKRSDLQNTELAKRLEKMGPSYRALAAWVRMINKPINPIVAGTADERYMMASPKGYSRLSPNQQLRLRYFIDDIRDLTTFDRRLDMYDVIRGTRWYELPLTDTQTYAFFDDITLNLRKGAVPSRDAIKKMLKE